MTTKLIDYAELFDTGQLKFHQTPDCLRWGVMLIKNPGWEDYPSEYVHFCIGCSSYVLDPTQIVGKDKFFWDNKL